MYLYISAEHSAPRDASRTRGAGVTIPRERREWKGEREPWRDVTMCKIFLRARAKSARLSTIMSDLTVQFTNEIFRGKAWEIERPIAIPYSPHILIFDRCIFRVLRLELSLETRLYIPRCKKIEKIYKSQSIILLIFDLFLSAWNLIVNEALYV